jgi:DNA-binding FadR family transcriptional regulator
VDEAGAERLSVSLEAERCGSAEERAQAVHDLHTAVAAVADNRALELVALVLIQLSRLRQIEKLPKRAFKEIAEQVHHTHGAIAESVISGDRELARHRMHRHLEALRPYIQ